MLSDKHKLFFMLLLVSIGFGLIIFNLTIFWIRRKAFSKLHVFKYTGMDGPRSALAKSQVNKKRHDRTKITKNRFESAGFYHVTWGENYLKIKYTLLVIGLFTYYFLLPNLSIKISQHVIFIAIWVLICVILPDFYLDSRSKQLRYKIANKLPYLLDLMAVCIQTGMTIESSIRYLSKEMAAFDKDICHYLSKTNERSQIVGLEKALDELHELVPSNEMRSFVVTLKQSLRYGSSIYTILTTLAKDIRELQMLSIEEKIGQLAAKMSIPLILFIMVPIVILIAAPGIMRLLESA
ncbi:type II secretion system F family protein [Moritella marina ATCC 15381]|uniref:Type II secretion system F family protein n=1 Tax=Moritella marina ATCC 15381 TaxID=1202962 RepID=A0A5J6WMS7_MORMI|nr:type II secretion system F family protein [Moritella marina]QFI38754.1 type II secretion system F family protein [Moritella marina ATCC 15381]